MVQSVSRRRSKIVWLALARLKTRFILQRQPVNPAAVGVELLAKHDGEEVQSCNLILPLSIQTLRSNPDFVVGPFMLESTL